MRSIILVTRCSFWLAADDGGVPDQNGSFRLGQWHYLLKPGQQAIAANQHANPLVAGVGGWHAGSGSLLTSSRFASAATRIPAIIAGFKKRLHRTGEPLFDHMLLQTFLRMSLQLKATILLSNDNDSNSGGPS